jgi:hypothetical protein
VLLLSRSAVAVRNEEVVLGACERNVEQPALIINSITLCAAGQILVLGCHDDHGFGRESFGLVHREDIDLPLVDFLFDILP